MANASSDVVYRLSGPTAHRTRRVQRLHGVLASALTLSLVLAAAPSPAAADGSSWTGVPLPALEGIALRSVAEGNGVWMAVGDTNANGSGVMRSVDGALSWTQVTVPERAEWDAVAYGGSGVWVAVARAPETSGGTAQVMRSTDDGLTWATTGITGVPASAWRSVAYANNLWVAVASSGTDRVMTSPDGLTWTARTAAQANQWRSVAYGGGRWVAVSDDTFANNIGGIADSTIRVMTSLNGETWTQTGITGVPTGLVSNRWLSVAYGQDGSGNGLWVAVSPNSPPNQIMTSPDGVAWTTRPSASDARWESVAYGGGVWVAVARSTGNDGNRFVVMRSTDGAATWSGVSQGVGVGWGAVAFGNGVWVAVRDSTDPRTMRSPAVVSGSSSQQSSSSSAAQLTPMLSGGSTPVVPAGEGVWQSADGSQVPLDVASPAAGQVRYAADGLTVTLAGASSTSATNGLVVAPNGEIACEVCLDLDAGNVIETWLFSQPRLVAAHLVGVEPCQTFTIPVGAPLDGLGAVGAGAHTLQLALPTASGMQAVNIGVTVGAPIPAAVPAGEGPTPLWTILLAGLAGVALMRWGLRVEA